MANTFAQIPADVQKVLATEAGMILTDFNPETPGSATEIQQALLFATTGGVTVSAVPEMVDLGEDIDNCPKNAKEMMRVKSWECTMSGTAVSVDTEAAKSLMGAVSFSADTVTPAMDIPPARFSTLWYVCPYGTNDGYIAIKLSNALSTGGLSLQSTDGGKGQFAFTYKGFSSLAEPNVVPFELHIKAGSPAL